MKLLATLFLVFNLLIVGPALGGPQDAPVSETVPIELAENLGSVTEQDCVGIEGVSPFDVNMEGEDYAQGCCKICRKGKACGNSCISRSKTCHKGKGCACDG